MTARARSRRTMARPRPFRARNARDTRIRLKASRCACSSRNSTQPTPYGACSPCARRTPASPPARCRARGAHARGSPRRAPRTRRRRAATALLGAEVGERVERIERTGVDAARGSHHEERLAARGAVGGDASAQRAEVHGEPFVHLDQPQRVRPDARDAQRFGDAVVHAARGICGQRRAGDAAAARAGLERRVARDRDREQIAHRRSARQDPARVAREAEELREPRDHLALDVHRGVLAAADVRVHPRGEHLREHARARSRPVHPAEEPRMPVAGRIRPHESSNADTVDSIGSPARGSGSRSERFTVSGTARHAGSSRRPSRSSTMPSTASCRTRRNRPSRRIERLSFTRECSGGPSRRARR